MKERIDNKELFIFDDSLHIRRASFNMLHPNKFCNDDIILCCVKGILQTMDQPKVHVFDPLLLKNLEEAFDDHSHKGLKNGSIDSLLFAKQIIVYPFNINNLHWVTYGKIHLL